MKGTTLSTKISTNKMGKVKKSSSKNSKSHQTTVDLYEENLQKMNESIQLISPTNSGLTVESSRPPRSPDSHKDRGLRQNNSSIITIENNVSKSSSNSGTSNTTNLSAPVSQNTISKSSKSLRKHAHHCNSHENSNSNNHKDKSSKSNNNFITFASALVALGGFAFLKTNIPDFMDSSTSTDRSGRYVRSTNVQASDSNAVFSSRVQNGVLEMYRTYVQPIYSDVADSISGAIGSSSKTSLPKNTKLTYIPSSAYDPTKTAHHVLEGAGYRLNIPSYVQSVPDGNDSQQSQNEDSTTNENPKKLSTNKNNNNNDNNSDPGPGIKNEEFDKAITNKQVITPRQFIKNNPPISNEKGIVRQAIYNPNDVPLNKFDTALDNIINDMLTKENTNDQVPSNPKIVNNSGNNFNVVNDQQMNVKLNNKTATEIFNKDSDLGECSPVKDIVFAKTHKTGGTTVTNMLLRHAEKQNLKVALPVEYHWELAGYPAEFDSKLITPKQDQYDIMCHHMRFDKPKIEKLVQPNADYFTILRDPVTNFESSFGFFKDYPFNDWLNTDRKINDFINNAETLYNKSTPWYFRAKNYMSYDLGFNHEDNSDDYIRYAIKEMEKNFKFVMITDRYEESMILLKNMLCLDYDDIAYLPLKVRTDNDRQALSKDSVVKIKQWNRLDTAIYEFYSKKFEQLTVEYGKEKLAKEVQILREKIKDVEARCVEDYDSQSLKPWIKRIKLRKPSGEKCQRLVWGEVKYADYLRQLQYGQLTEEQYNDQPTLEQKVEYMQQVQEEVLGPMQ